MSHICSYDPNYPARCANVAAGQPGDTMTVTCADEKAGAARAYAETAGLEFTSAATREGGQIILTFTKP